MKLFTIAVRFVDGLLKDVGWWPTIVRQDTTSGARVLPWALMPLELYIGKFLKESSEHHERDWTARGVFLLNEYYYTLDRAKFTEAMVYLLASDTETLSSVIEWMQSKGYDLGKYDTF